MAFSSWFASRRSPIRRQQRNNARQKRAMRCLLRLETLEDRTVPTGVPVLHSYPGAAATLFLDFDGHVGSARTTPVYDADGDATTFSTAELAFIEDLWRVVAEDYAPFNINVTTVEPAVLAPGVPDSAANGVALRIAIGGTNPNGSSGGGLAMMNSFTNSQPNLAWVFAQGQTDPVSYGQSASHEAGHSFGLQHQSLFQSEGYSTIMFGAATSLYPALWHNGVDINGMTQDDMAVLANANNGFGYRIDDHGNTTATATALTPTGNTWSGAGIVGTNTDVDMFSFSVTTEDTYRFTVQGLTASGEISIASNLDVAFELRDSAGNVLGNSNPSNTRSADIREGLTPGTYFLAVKSNGVYGRIGQYTISSDTPPPGITVTPAQGALTTGEDGLQTSFSVVLQTQPTADVTIAVSSTNTAEGTASVANLVFTSANWDVPQTVTLTGVNDGITDDDTAYGVILGAAVSADVEYSGLDPSDLAVVNLKYEASGFIYYTDAQDINAATIRRSRLDGSQAETLVDMKALFGTGSSTPYEIAVDQAAGKFYWTDSTQEAIRRANLDGTSVETVVSFPTANLRGISLDVAAGKMYWIENDTHKIQRANLNGSGIEDLVTDVAMYTRGLALDVAAGKMYWAQGNLIRRANLNGTNSEVLWTGVTSSSGAIALDVTAGKMYWGDFVENVIRRANLDGTSVEVVVDATLTGATQIRGLALDIPAGKMYWADYPSRSTYRANLDGSMIATVGSGAGYNGLAIAHLPPGISVTHRTGLVTKEDGSSDFFRVSLTTQPTADVTIALSTSDATEGTLSTYNLTFTPTNWNITQTVTVSGVNDAVVDGNIAYTIVLAPAVSSDANYHGHDPADASVVNTDDDVLPTKFYVVNDATQNQTYEYNAIGGSVELYSLNSGNTAPRGAASTIVGDKTWVVDANRKVYVYDSSGGLLGSWTAGTLASNATVEGITTNGTDIWIVDAKSDKVYKYTGAATRLSGSQNAASSFNLNGSNSSPKDLVTDGTSIWVVNDSSTDKVFKYTVAGSLLGSWTLSTSGASSPTGITIDPANVSNIWIVDSGTDRVYQYTAAASRTSGSQSAASNFALAVGNTNPQGIADPPVNGGPAFEIGTNTKAKVAADGVPANAPSSGPGVFTARELADLIVPRVATNSSKFWATWMNGNSIAKKAHDMGARGGIVPQFHSAGTIPWAQRGSAAGTVIDIVNNKHPNRTVHLAAIFAPDPFDTYWTYYYAFRDLPRPS
jgi:hypothetical protein